MKERLERKLKQQVIELDRELRIELPRQIKLAVALGDLSENAEYHAALERQTFVRARIGQIRKRLAELALVNWGDIPKDRIGLGSRVVLYEDETESEITYELVLPMTVTRPRVASPSPRPSARASWAIVRGTRSPSGSHRAARNTRFSSSRPSTISVATRTRRTEFLLETAPGDSALFDILHPGCYRLPRFGGHPLLLPPTVGRGFMA